MNPMTHTKSLLVVAAALILFDAAATVIAVLWMGAPELNLLVNLFGFYGFMAIKVIFSAVALCALYTYYLPRAPRSVRAAAIVLCLLFGLVCANNVWRIISAVM